MKAVVIFVLLFAVVFCHPVKRSASSSESSEEQSVTQLNLKFAAVTDVVPTTVDNSEDDDSDDDDDDAAQPDDDDDDKDDTSESDESQETTTSIPFLETTQIIYVDTGRGDSMGFYSDSKKSIYYEKGNYIEKEPLNYKSYGFEKIEADPASRKTSDLKVYKVLQVHDVVDHGMGTSSGTESEDPSESEQVDPQQDQNMKTAATAVDDNSSPESSEESSEETATVAPSTDGVNLRTGNIETVDSDSANTSSQSSELPVILTK